MKDKSEVAKLEKLIHNMDLPFNRKAHLNPTKLRWLHKNMGERNSTNPNYHEALRLTEKLISDG